MCYTPKHSIHSSERPSRSSSLLGCERYFYFPKHVWAHILPEWPLILANDLIHGLTHGFPHRTQQVSRLYLIPAHHLRPTCCIKNSFGKDKQNSHPLLRTDSGGWVEKLHTPYQETYEVNSSARGQRLFSFIFRSIVIKIMFWHKLVTCVPTQPICCSQGYKYTHCNVFDVLI